jgi:hypothetical protein
MAAVGAGSAGFRRPDQIDPIVTADTILTVSPEGMAAEPGSVDGLPVVYEFDPGASSWPRSVARTPARSAGTATCRTGSSACS